jgi:hypothetical protein
VVPEETQKTGKRETRIEEYRASIIDIAISGRER